MDPVTYPKVNLGGTEYEVKFRAGDIIRLKKTHNVELGEMANLKGAEAFERMIILLQAGISHSAQMTTEQIGDQIELADFPIYTKAVMDAISKVSPQARQALDQMTLAAAPATKQ